LRRTTIIFSWLLWFWAAALDASEGSWAELGTEIRARGLDPEQVTIPGRLTDEMRAWVHSLVPPGTPEDEALRRLLGALIDPRGFELVYDATYTGTAGEVFATRRANCLAFTHLFVGLTRELGIPTYYVRWAIGGRARREGDLVLVSGHVTAGFGYGRNRRLLEFGAVSGLETFNSHRISDLDATALHYANRSAELLQVGRVSEAVSKAEISTRLNPSLPDGWVNLGVARRRSGDPAGAEEAYRRATVADPDHLPAYHNLMTLYELQGRKDAAQEIFTLLDRRDNHNPFILLELGDESLQSDRLDEAGRFYRKALRFDRSLAETRAAWGTVALRQGEVERARKWLRRAQAVDPQESRTRALTLELSQLDDSSE